MTSRATYWLALALGLIGFGLLVRHFAFVCDDAYITFRYARNLAEGRGLVFNPGESPRVEGYSNLLWTLVLALAYRLGSGGAALGAAANALSIACGAGLLALVVRAAVRRVDPAPAVSALTAVFLGTLVPFALWSTGGLETMPFSLALFATWERLEGERGRPRPWQAGAAAAAAALLRADGFLWLAALLGLVGLGALARRERALLRALAITGALAAAVVGAQFLWRHAYYGEWLPNTARVKTGFSALRLERGLKYLGTLALGVPALALAPLLALAARGRAADEAAAGSSGVAWRAAGVLAFGCVYAVYAGGDFMAMGRFLVPTLPFLALLAAGACARLARRSAALALTLGSALIAAGLLIGLDLAPVPDAWLQALHFRWNSPAARSEHAQWEFQKLQAEGWSELGRALDLNTLPGESLIRGPVGAVGYYSELEVLDLNGLVTLEVARREAEPQRVSPGHDKHVEPDFFFPRRPTYLEAGLAPVGAPDLAGVSPMGVECLRRGLASLERRPLRPEDGFAPGLELRLVRFRWP